VASPRRPRRRRRRAGRLHAVLCLALEQARRDDLVARNVAGLVAGPKVQHAEVHPLTPAEAAQLFAAAAEDRLSPLWLLVTALGLRRGEALALRWEDVDLDRGHLKVRATVQRLNGALVRTEMPKTKSSRRALPLPDVVVEALRAHRAAQVQERLRSAIWADQALVFTTGIGTPLEPRNVLRSFHALCICGCTRREEGAVPTGTTPLLFLGALGRIRTCNLLIRSRRRGVRSGAPASVSAGQRGAAVRQSSQSFDPVAVSWLYGGR
jgi:integrase